MASISFKASDGTSFRFVDTKQLQDFVSNEIAAWAWLSGLTNNAPGQQLYQHIVTPLTNALGYLRDQQPTPEILAALTPQVQSYFNTNPAVHPKSPLRQELDRRAKEDPYEAMYFLATVFQKLGGWQRFADHHGGQSSYTTGIALGTGYVEGWKENEKAAASANVARASAEEASTSLAEIRELQANAKAVAQGIEDLDRAERATLAQLLATLRAENDALRSELRTEVDSTKAGLNAEWKALTATYDAQLALKAPANYWAIKRRNHAKWVAGLSLLTSVTAIAGALGLSKLAVGVFGALPVGTLPTWLQAISFALGSIVYLWTLRSLLRFVLSHAHLALDAAERRTMILSYLALIRKQGVKAEAMEQVFTSIFRPSGDGIVKDEGIPLPSLLELLMKRG